MAKKVKKVKILGTTYTVHYDVSEASDSGVAERFGYCNILEHKIVLRDLNDIPDWAEESDEVKVIQRDTTLRHEIIHAFLCESGLWGSTRSADSWAMNEEMVDWIALQFPKLLKIYRELGCEGC